MGSVVVIAVAMASCGGSSSPGWFAHRSRLPSCGTVDVRLVIGAAPPRETDEVACLLHAQADGTQAELVLHTLPKDGVVVEYYRVLGHDGAELITHRSHFKETGNGWSLAKCRAFDLAENPRFDPVLVGTGCTDATPA